MKNPIFWLIDRKCSTQLGRRKFSEDSLKVKMANIPYTKPTREQKKAIRAYWGKYKINYDAIAMCNALNPSEKGFDVRYMPYDLHFCYVDPYYSNASAAQVLDDKNYYDMFFHDVQQPKTLARKIDGTFLTADYAPTTENDIAHLIENVGGAIVKVSIGSEGGYGCKIWHQGEDESELKKILGANRNVVIQELVQQHEQLSKLHPESVNTIRIMSLIRDGEVRIVSSILRMGVGTSYVDNASSGGLYCGIDSEKGCLKKNAYTREHGFVKVHPTTGVLFEGYPIPSVDKCQELVKRLAWRISRTTRLASWDFSVDSDSNPIFIEVNMAYGGIQLHQSTNGPLFGDDTRAIVDAAFRKSKLKRLAQRVF